MLNELLLGFSLDDEGELRLGQFGEGCENEIRNRAYQLEASQSSRRFCSPAPRRSVAKALFSI